MDFDADKIEENAAKIGKYGAVAGLLADVLKDGAITTPYLSLIRESAGVIKPLIEEAGDWGLTYHIKHLKTLMQEFGVTPMEASQMLALKARSSMLGQAVENVNTSKKHK